MSETHAQLLARRERLIARAAEQRDAIARDVGEIQAAVDRGRTWLGAVKKAAPLIGVGLGVGTLLLARSRVGIAGVIKGGLAAWKIVRLLK